MKDGNKLAHPESSSACPNKMDHCLESSGVSCKTPCHVPLSVIPDKNISEASSDLADLFLPNFIAFDIELQSDNSFLGDQNCVNDQDSPSQIVAANVSSHINQPSVKASSEH